MVELVELEQRHADFDKKGAKVVAISRDEQTDAQATQTRFPHLVIVSDADQNLAKALGVVHPGAGHAGEDTNAPTTFYVDGAGIIRWLARPERFTTRLSPD